jgi:uncharacterized protein
MSSQTHQEITDVAKLTYYVVDLVPVEHTAMTPDVIGKHTAHLRELDNEGKLVLGGPFDDGPGGLLVLNCGDKAAAEAIMSVDPLIVSGVNTFRVHTWLVANAANNYAPARTKGP